MNQISEVFIFQFTCVIYIFPCCACSTDAVWFNQQIFTEISLLFSLHLNLLGLAMMDESFPELGQLPADCGEWIHPVSPWLARVLQACLNTSVSFIQESKCMQEWAIGRVDAGMSFVCILQTYTLVKERASANQSEPESQDHDLLT